MSPKLQVKLLRVLQEHEFERVGESRTIRVDSRVIAATNQLLEDEIAAGRFRDDLYYRLNVVPIYLPPLRERREDIPALARHFLAQYSEENRRDPPELTPALEQVLLSYEWAGNVRELENCVERAVILAHGKALTPEMLVPPDRSLRRWQPLRSRGSDLDALIQQVVRAGIQTIPAEEGRLYEHIVRGVERELVEQVMQISNHNQSSAAARLGINRNTLKKKLNSGKTEDKGRNMEAE
jgi:DNA-binding NtrC family response regulator